MAKTVAIAILCVGLTTACARPAFAQTNGERWKVNGAATLALTPGIGAATTGAGVVGSVALVRSGPNGEFLERPARGLGVVVALQSIWTRGRPGAQQSILAGPRLEASEEGMTLFIQALAGAKQGAAADGSRGAFAAFGAGMGIDFAAWRVIEVNWVATPADRLSRHRLTISSGVSLGWTLRRF